MVVIDTFSTWKFVYYSHEISIFVLSNTFNMQLRLNAPLQFEDYFRPHEWIYLMNIFDGSALFHAISLSMAKWGQFKSQTK